MRSSRYKITYNEEYNQDDYNIENTCCFTGHRPQKLPWGPNENDPRCLETKRWIYMQIKQLYDLGYRQYMCGMAIGCDMYFAERVLILKAEHDDVLLFGAIPCASQPEKWNRAQKIRYTELLLKCGGSCRISEEYTGTCMMERNRFMVDNSSAVIACYDGYPGGTMKTILYAQRENKDIRILDVN